MEQLPSLRKVERLKRDLWLQTKPLLRKKLHCAISRTSHKPKRPKTRLAGKISFSRAWNSPWTRLIWLAIRTVCPILHTLFAVRIGYSFTLLLAFGSPCCFLWANPEESWDSSSSWPFLKRGCCVAKVFFLLMIFRQRIMSSPQWHVSLKDDSPDNLEESSQIAYLNFRTSH